MMSSSENVWLWEELSTAYCKKHNITWRRFSSLDDKYNLLQFIASGSDLFNHMGTDEAVCLIEKYIRRRRRELSI